MEAHRLAVGIFHHEVDPQTDDVLDDLADLVSEMGGEVVIVPAEGMTTDTGLAAIYCY